MQLNYWIFQKLFSWFSLTNPKPIFQKSYNIYLSKESISYLEVINYFFKVSIFLSLWFAFLFGNPGDLDFKFVWIMFCLCWNNLIIFLDFKLFLIFLKFMIYHFEDQLHSSQSFNQMLNFRFYPYFCFKY